MYVKVCFWITFRSDITCEYWKKVCDGQVAEIEVGHVLSHESKLENDDDNQDVTDKTTHEDDDVDEWQQNHPFQRQRHLRTKDVGDVLTVITRTRNHRIIHDEEMRRLKERQRNR